MENTPDVHGNSSPAASEGVIPQTQLPETPAVVPEPATPPKGSQTPSENLYAALAEERRLRKETEDKLLTFNTAAPAEEVYSDEGRMLKQQLDALQDKVELRELQDKFPQLKELSDEFIEFKKDYPQYKGESVAKLFLAEKGLLETPRKGLEKPTGGQRVPQTLEMNYEEVKNLRETNFKLYMDKVKKGLIKV